MSIGRSRQTRVLRSRHRGGLDAPLPTAAEATGGAGTFAVFGVMAVAAFVFVIWMAPETKGRPLEDIGQFWENGGSWTLKP